MAHPQAGRRRPDGLHQRRYGVRSLHIGSDTIQSSMRLSRPYDLELAYTRSMMAFLLFRAQPRSVLMNGLGGGSVPKFIYRHMPGVKVHVVEVNADVVSIARHCFKMPPDDERLAVSIGEARIRDASRGERGYRDDRRLRWRIAGRSALHEKLLRGLLQAVEFARHDGGQSVERRPAVQRSAGTDQRSISRRCLTRRRKNPGMSLSSLSAISRRMPAGKNLRRGGRSYSSVWLGVRAFRGSLKKANRHDATGFLW